MKIWKWSDTLLVIFFLLFLLGCVVRLVIVPIAYRFSDEMDTIEITEKYTKYQGQNNHYMLMLPDETVEVADTIMFWRFDSSDLYRELEEGNC